MPPLTSKVQSTMQLLACDQGEVESCTATSQKNKKQKQVPLPRLPFWLWRCRAFGHPHKWLLGDVLGRSLGFAEPNGNGHTCDTIWTSTAHRARRTREKNIRENRTNDGSTSSWRPRKSSMFYVNAHASSHPRCTWKPKRHQK